VLPSLIYTYQEAANAAINEAAQELVDFSSDVASKILGDLVAECKKKGVDASFVHKVGDPAEVILSVAKAHGADLIVIGSKGLSGLSRLRALGSVARRVSEHSTCPVLIVR
jgi:nucleotide-binding universal stress UspA family protein